MSLSILHIASGDLWAGAEAQICNLLTHWAHTPSLQLQAIVFNQGQLSARLESAGVAVRTVDERQLTSRQMVGAIRDIVANVRPDVIHTHDYKETILASLACPDIPQLRTVHGDSEPFTGLAALRSFATSRIDRWFCNHRVAHLIAVSSDLASRLQHWARTPVSTIHNGVDLDTLDRTVPAPLRTELVLDDGPLLVGMVGRLVAVKRCELLLQALPQVPNAHAVLVGDGPQRTSLEALALQLDVADRVSFLGFRHDAAAVMASLDCLAIVSAHEGIPTVLLEAMALHVPVLATTVGGIPEVIDQQSAMMLPPSGADLPMQIATALRSMGDRAATEKRTLVARQRVEDHFSTVAQAAKTMRVYADVLSRSA